MHQPIYYTADTQIYQLPWTYLHGIKDYVDMAAHLEACPQAKAVVNFAPTLLEQLDDYTQQINAYRENGTPLRDPLLAALVSETDVVQAERSELITQCLRVNRQRVINRFSAFQHLAGLAEKYLHQPDLLYYADRQYFTDLLMWYHLGWIGETVRRTDPRIKALMEQQRGYSAQQQHDMLDIMGELLSSIVPRYRALMEKGQIELSFTPYAHPIMPLLINFHSAHEALPDCPLPKEPDYPEGKPRVRWHIHEGIEVFKRYFGVEPQGCWPSEGSVCNATVRILEEFGVHWIASGETVLRNSLKKAQMKTDTHCPYHLPDSHIQAFFRDDNLSDLIGFEYQNWHADDAVANVVYHLNNIAKHHDALCEQKVVAIIMDGENAWESYPENAYYFLSALYKQLSKHPRLNLTTFSECAQVKNTLLPSLVAGSWVYGTFSTWIGEKDKNQGWDMLIAAKNAFDKQWHHLDEAQRDAAERQLAICEGSDWFWWFGDINPSESVRDFDRLYRLHLSKLYQLLDLPEPEYLHYAFSHGGGTPAAGGVMRKGKEG